METSCDNPFTTGAMALRAQGLSKPIRFGGVAISLLEKRCMLRSGMLARQRLGIVMMIVFMPANGPFWRMAIDALGIGMEFSDSAFFAYSILLFITGGVLTFTPKTIFG